MSDDFTEEEGALLEGGDEDVGPEGDVSLDGGDDPVSKI